MALQKEKKEFWTRVKELAKKNIKPQSYDFFIEPAQLLEIENDVATIIVGAKFHKDFWRSQEGLISTAGFEIFDRPIRFNLLSEEEVSEKIEQESNEQDGFDEAPALATPDFTRLNPKYIFDNYIQGEGNKWAKAAAFAVADKPGDVYNPLFIYGGSGLGKTHLMHAIGNEILKDNPHSKVKYVSAETFVNDYVNATRKGQMAKFEETYRNLDILLLDDVQFFSDKEGTQNEFFNTFNTLHDRGAQIVLTSDRIPQELNKLEERLVTRFSWGLTTDITAPDYETRMAILKKKAETSGYNIDEGVLQYIANHFVSNVRELEGSLTRVITFSKISHSPITVDFASGVLQELVAPNQENAITCEYIINIVADHFQISPTDICSKKKSREFAYPRQICMYLCRVFTDEKLETIGAALKKTNHATVSYGYDKIKSEIETDSKTRDLIDVLKKKINPN